jgi:hypothetical protein
MHPYLTAMAAEAHRNELLRQAKQALPTALARSRRRRASSHVVVRALQPARALPQRSAT